MTVLRTAPQVARALEDLAVASGGQVMIGANRANKMWIRWEPWDKDLAGIDHIEFDIGGSLNSAIKGMAEAIARQVQRRESEVASTERGLSAYQERLKGFMD